MSASQPIRCVKDFGALTSNNTTPVVKNAFIIKTGILHISVSTSKDGGSVGVCNTTTSDVGMVTSHVNKQSSMLLRYGHPASATVIGIATGSTTTLEVNHPDTKIVKGDRVTLIGSSVAAYNNTIKHVEVLSVNGPQRVNDYKMTIVINANTTSISTAFSGIATVAKSVIPVLYPESNNGCTAYIQEAQLG
jgi:hypothetical protein